MRTLSSIRSLKYILPILVLFSTFGCESWMRNPLDDKETGEKVKILIVDFNFIKTKLAIHLKDVDTNEYIEGDEMEIIFLGDDADNVITFTGTKPDKFTTSSGFLEVGIDPNIPISAEDPLSLSVVAIGNNYVSAPMALSYSKTGLKDVIIKVVNIGIKSGSTGGYDEPYEISYNGSSPSSDLGFVRNITALSTGTAYDYLNLYNTDEAGQLLCSNISDPAAYPDYGIYYIFSSSGLVPPEAPSKDATLAASTLVYSTVLRSGLATCSDGLTLKISSSNGTAGSGSFPYLITYSDGTTDDGIITGTFPFEVTLDNLVYPLSDPSVSVQVFQDAQYTLSGSVSLSTACGQTAEFTATPKTGLKPYKWIVRYSCPDLAASFALSIGGEFKEVGTDNAWTRFQFVEGIANLQLIADAEYHFRINIDGESYAYDLPTDPATLEDFLNQNQSEDFYKIKTLTITPTANLVTVEADVELAGDICDIIN